MSESELLQKGHTRSVSAGGTSTGHLTRPSALRKGHQRAFSHGEIGAEDAGFVKGHNRVSSKAEFILPPGHRESSEQTHKPGHARTSSRTESEYTLQQAAPPSCLDQLIAFLLRKKAKSEHETRTRTVVPNHILPPGVRGSGDNKIRTTKYTIFDFIVKNLLEQFHRVANLYFIFIVFLNWVPSINAFGKEIAMIPVVFVIGVTAIKDLFEDRQRRASDKRINNSTCRVYDGEVERYTKVTWKELKVGDIVHLSNNEVVPADILLLKSSDTENGTCYLDTCNLDGESNLKLRNIPEGFHKEPFNPREFKNVIQVDPPSTKLYQFYGAIVNPSGGKIPVSTDHLLLRDSVIKNTDFVEGIVVYAGHETKAMLNSSAPRYKRSSLEKQMNTDVLWCVFMLIVLCAIGSICAKFWLDTFPNPHNVLFIILSSTTSFEAWLTFWTFIIILQVMIPLSLYVTLELTKILQVYHIDNNLELYDAETDKRTVCRALNITEELGQIEYLFSDKTGTLTENKMVFRRCTIGGTDYNHPSAKSLKGESLSMQLTPNQKLLKHLQSDGTPESERAKEFLLALALCNTVVVANHPHHDIMNSSGALEGETPSFPRHIQAETPLVGNNYRRLVEERSITPSPTPEENPYPFNPEDMRLTSCRSRMKPTLSPISSSGENSPTTVPKSSPKRPKLLNIPSMSMFFPRSNSKNDASPKISTSLKPIFEAESPDELALVQMAFIYNCRLVKRYPTKAIVSLPGEYEAEYEILKVLPFDSDRKCMSVVIRKPTNEIIVYTKGADSSIFPRLCNPKNETKTNDQISRYANEGLRVLAVASRRISEEEWAEIKEKLDHCRGKTLAATRLPYSMVESKLNLMGATGIEDRLQSGVPETLKSLRAAGIVVWVLTGDKVETATNVALASGLFSPQTLQLKLFAQSKTSAEACLRFHKDEIIRANRFSSTEKQKAIIIDGKTLTFILDERSGLTQPFLELTKYCTAVLCCRVTPLQKAFIVKVVKERLRKRTLAIGDGANDVSMIRAAHVGIGISGQEGMQAIMASDFSIAKFKFLRNLMLVHGHWAYQRIATMVLYFFYKNATFVFLIFWCQLYCGFSGTVMIDPMFHMLYNLIFTSLPPVAIGVYDQDAPAKVLLSSPHLYDFGRLGKAYNRYSFWIIVLDSIYQSLAIFFIAVGAYNGSEIGIWEFGSTITSSCMFAMLGQVSLETKSWTLLHVASLILSIGAYYGFFLLYNMVCMQCIGLSSNTWVMKTTIGDLSYYLILLLSTVTALLPRFVCHCLLNIIWPDDITKAVVESKMATAKGNDFLISWSRSTSTSSIYRGPDNNRRPVQMSSLTAVG